jgi:hypothetical protein
VISRWNLTGMPTVAALSVSRCVLQHGIRIRVSSGLLVSPSVLMVGPSVFSVQKI